MKYAVCGVQYFLIMMWHVPIIIFVANHTGCTKGVQRVIYLIFVFVGADKISRGALFPAYSCPIAPRPLLEIFMPFPLTLFKE